MRRMFGVTRGHDVFWLGLVLTLGTFAIAGCNRGPTMYQVKGHVSFKGGGSMPAKAGVALVGFKPSKDTTATVRKGASGPITPDGSFEMYTRKPGDGVFPGDYDVVFVIRKSPMDVSTSLLPAKYENGSGYTVKVNHDMSDLDYEIELLPGAPKD